MRTLVDCGCETKVHADGSGVEVYFCPLHEAATDLLEALKKAVLRLERIEGFGCPQEVLDEMRATIRKAKGE